MATYCTRIYVKVAKQDLMEKLRTLDISDIGKGFYQAKDIFASTSAECTFQDGESAINESDLQTLVARVVEVIRGQGTILAETWSYDYDPFPQVCYYNGDEIVSKLLDMDGAELKETVNINDVSAWIDFVENADEYETDEDGMDDDDQDALASLPRFICDTDTINQLASAEPDITRCDPNLTFVMDYTDEPVTVLFASATDEVKKIAGQLRGVEMDDEADAYILFFRRTTFPVNAFSVGMIAYAAVNWKTKGIKGGSSNERINRYFGPVVGAMLRMNIWLQQDDTYERYQKLNGETSAMLVTANEGEITACVVQGKERPNMQCENLLNMQTLFAEEPEVVSARPYRDEIFNIWNREMMSIEEKTERAEAGDTDCMDELAMQYLNGDDAVKAEPEKALYWFRKLAEAGHPNGMFNLGLFYAKGFCVPRDFKLAAEWMRKAEAAGDDDATPLVEMYTSMMEAEAKAKQGNAEAQAVLAKGLMQLGNSLEQAGSGNDYKESVEWAQKAAAQGNAAAMWVLALAHHHGRGVKQNMDLAIAYYKKGADMGNADCMHNLGCEYLSGEHLWKNAKKGFELVKRAAEMGNGLAMYNLGRAYQFGNGCIGNMKKALEWYEKAAEVLHDPQIEQRVMAFRSLSEFQPDFDKDYSGEEDPCEDVPLERTQYEGRADRCKRLRPGTVLEYRFAKDQNNQPVLEMFYQGGSVGVISHFTSEKIIEFLKKDRITLKVIVKSCIPKSQRGARARSADVKLTLEIDDKIPGVPVEVAEHPTKKPDVERKKEETHACKAPVKNEIGTKEIAYLKENDLPYDQETLDHLTPYDVMEITEGTYGKETGKGKQQREKAQKTKADRKREEEKKAEENRKRKEELARQEAQKKEAERKQQEACKAKEDAVAAKRNAEVKRCDEDIKKWTEQKTSAEQKLASLGFLRFGEKKRQREIIEASMVNIEKSKSEKANLITKYDQELMLIRAAAKHGVNVSNETDLLKFAICDALKDGRSHLMSEITQACPVLAELSSGRMIALMGQLTLEGKVTRSERSMKTYFQLEKDPVYAPASPARSTASAPPTPTQIENESYKRMILDLLRDGRRYTVTDIQKANSKLGDLSNQRLSALLRQLLLTGEVLRVEINQVYYFEIAD